MISVIVPVHNTEKYLWECIESILCQSYSDLEVICIDSSTDNSSSILKDFSKADSRVRYIFDTNSSYGYKINRGIALAKGEYIAVVDSDDYIESDMYESLICLAEQYGVDFIKSDYDFFFTKVDGGRNFTTYQMTRFEEAYGEVFSVSEHLNVLADSGPSIWTGLYRTGFLKDNHIEINESPGASFQDTGFFVLTHIYAKRILYVHDSFYRYRTDNAGASTKSLAKYRTIAEEFFWIEEQLRARKLDNEGNRIAIAEKKITSYLWNFNRLRGDVALKFVLSIEEELKKQFYEGHEIDRVDSEYQEMCRKLMNLAGRFHALEAKKLKTITVIVPIHNTGKYIKECLESICDQIYSNLEILCIDSSTDGTTAIVKELSEKDSRILHIIDPNSSYGYKLNRGIREAKGEYIGIVDSDDYIERDMYFRLLEEAEENRVDFVKADFSSFYTQNGENVVFRYDVTQVIPELYGRVISCAEIPEIFYRSAVNIWSGLYRTDFLRDNNIIAQESAGASFQDAGFSVLAYLYGKRVLHLNESYYRYRTDNTNSSVKSAKKANTIIEEYRWIDKEVAKRKIATPEVLNAMSIRKLNTYCWNFERLDTETGMQFARKIRDELKQEFLDTDLYDKLPPEKKQWFDRLYYAGMDRETEVDVSVIIPVYNTGLYLAECLDSVLSQVGVKAEIICVNDGSTDNSGEILKAYSEKDKRIAIINQENAGLACARNTGLKAAKGKYTLFVDSDDMLAPFSLLDLWVMAENNMTDVVLFDAECLYETETLKADDSKDIFYHRKRSFGLKDGKDMFTELMEEAGNFCNSACLMFINSSWLNGSRISFIPGMIYEDTPFSAACMMKAKRVLHTNSRYYIYRIRESSTMTSPYSVRSLHGAFIGYDYLRSLFDHEPLNDRQRSALLTYLEGFHGLGQKIYSLLSPAERSKIFDYELSWAQVLKLMEIGYTKSDIQSYIFRKRFSLMAEKKKIVIYGAGLRTKRLLHYFRLNNINPDELSIVVSKRVGNPDAIENIMVFALDEGYRIPQDHLILVPLAGTAGTAVVSQLREEGYENVVFLNKDENLIIINVIKMMLQL